MTEIRSHFALATACIGLLAGGAASATAQIGGVVSTSFAEAFGACNKSALVPLTTLQDNFTLDLTAPCAAGSAGGNLKAAASTGSAGLKVFAAGTGAVAAQVSLIDNWVLTPPPGTAAGNYMIPVHLQIDGTVSAGATTQRPAFLDYGLTLRDVHGGSLPLATFTAYGSVTASGAYSQSYDNVLGVRYFGPGGGLQTTVETTVQMSVGQLASGTIDFYNTAFASLALPAGWSAVTSSGLPVVSAVPEPATAVLMLYGVGVLVACRATPRRSDVLPT